MEYGLRQAGNLSYSEPSSPERFTPPGYFDNQLQAPQNQITTFPGVSGPPAAATSYHPRYENPTAASMNSLQRTIYNAEAALQRGFSEFQEQPENQYTEPIAFDDIPIGDRAQFPVTAAHSGIGFQEPVVYNPDMYLVPSHNPSVILQDPSGADLYPCFVTMPEERNAITEADMPAFPSQLLQSEQVASEFTPRPFEPQELVPAKEDPEEAQSPPKGTESRLKSPPPPTNIAARRNKPKLSSLGTPAIRDRSSTGPKTTNNSDSTKRMHGSPSSAMRRVSSVNGSLNVLAGRIQKPAGYLPQRSPLQRHFSISDTVAFLEKNAHNINQPTVSWLNKPLDPPTPSSPRDNQFSQKVQGAVKLEDTTSQGENTHEDQTVSQEGNSSASPSVGEGASYIFNRAIPGCFATTGLSNMASPPETPANAQHPPHWGFEAPDEALLTPGFGTFATEGSMHMPQPHYVSSLTSSQPPTPAFGQFTGFPYHQSPVFDMAPLESTGVEYYFPDGGVSQYSMMSNKSLEQPREKIYTFNNATQKDFE
jgi:hypothetical protein